MSCKLIIEINAQHHISKSNKSTRKVSTQSKQLRDPLLCRDPPVEQGCYKPVPVPRSWLSVVCLSVPGAGLLRGRPQHQRLPAPGAAHQPLLLLQRLGAAGLPGESCCIPTSNLHLSSPSRHQSVFPCACRLCRAAARRCWQRAGLSTCRTFSRAPRSSITSSPA